jgi:DedD protein
VADLTHDNPDDGFHEIHLSGKQLVFLFMATTVVSVVIFLCGVLVGRGVRAQQEAGPDSAIAGAVAPTEMETPVSDTGPPAAEPPSPPDEGELSYKRRLESETPTPEVLQKPEPERPRAPSRREPAPPPAPAAAAADRTAGSARPGTWVVQVHALRDREVASQLVRRLAGKGYPAFLVAPASGAPAIYRVQVGRFTDRAEAENVVLRLKKEEQFNSWVTR